MFRFTIRDLLWLTVVVALGVGWWLRERDFKAHSTSLRAQTNVLEYVLETEGVTVKWNDDRTIVTTFGQSKDVKRTGHSLYVPAFLLGPNLGLDFWPEDFTSEKPYTK